MTGFFSRLGELLVRAGRGLSHWAGKATSSAWSGLSGFWFSPQCPLLLGALRVGVGGALLWMLLASAPLLGSWYGPEAWVGTEAANRLREETPFNPPTRNWDGTPDRTKPYRPELNAGPEAQAYLERWGTPPGSAYSRGLAQFSPFFHIRSREGLYAFHAFAILVAVLFLLGLGGRLVCVAAWATALCYLHRVAAAQVGADTLLSVLLLYLAVGPSTQSLSLDRRFNLAPPPAPSEAANIALRLVQVHFALICLASGASKLQGPAWWNGTALWRLVANGELVTRDEAYWGLLRLLTQSRLVWELIGSVAGSLFTLLLQLGLPFLIWFRRWRWACIVAAVLWHTAAALVTGFLSFHLLMVLMVGSFLPAPLVGAEEAPQEQASAPELRERAGA